MPGTWRCQHLLLSLPFQGRAGTWGRKDSQTGDVLGGVGGPWHKRMLVLESPENWGL